MTRCFGDRIMRTVGVISEPEITKFQLDLEENEYIVVMGSDGLFEYLSNQNIIRIVIPYRKKYQMKSACDELIKQAEESWKRNSVGMDDTTCIVVAYKQKKNL